MKKILLILVIVIWGIILTTILDAQWIKQNSGTNEELTDVVMLDSVTAIAVGRGRSILRTNDAGKTWDNRTIMHSSVMPWNAVDFKDSLNGVVAGDNQVRITSDGGKSWFVNTPPFQRKFLSALYLPGGGLYVGADSGWIYSYSDYSKTWTSEKISDEDIRSIFIFRGAITSRLPMYALTPFSLYETSFNEDGSQDPWTKIPIPVSGLGSAVFDGEFSLGGGTGFIVGVQGDFWAEPIIIRMQDTGWIPVNINNLEAGSFNGISAPSENFAYACGTNGMIFNSSNGGTIWNRQESPFNSNLNAISFYNNSTGMTVGDSGTILFTKNGGLQPDNIGPLVPYGLQNKVITSLAADELDYGGNPGFAFKLLFAATDKDGVFKLDSLEHSSEWQSFGLEGKYINALGIQHWGVGPIDGLSLLAAVNPYFENDDTTLIYQREANLKSDSTWRKLDSGIVKSNTSVYAVNAFYFSGHTPPGNIIAGTNSGIYNFKNNFWEQINDDARVSDIDVYPHWYGNLVWATGSYGHGQAAFKSTDAGETWRQYFIPHPNDGGASSVSINTRFTDSVYFAVHGSIYLTPDSGATFNEIFFDTNGKIKVVALDPLAPENIFAGGSIGGNSFYFITSTDGGNNWNQVEPLVNTPINNITSIAVVNEVDKTSVFLGTEGTGVWRYTSPLITNIKSDKNYPGEFKLYQNYPNPFNPSTVISYQLIVGSYVSLKVYDILGKEVATLVNEERPAGEYKVNFNSTSLSSGVYFYVLNASGNRLSRKMCLLK